MNQDHAFLIAIRAESNRGRRQRLIQAFATAKMGLARAFARRWRATGMDPRDVEQAAYLGLMVAINGWDPERAGGGWSSYAHRCMATAILRGPVAAQTVAHVPRTVREDRRRIVRALAAGVDAEPAALAAATGLTVARVEAVALAEGARHAVEWTGQSGVAEP